MTIPKRKRRQLAKAEALLMLAIRAEGWANDIEGKNPSVRPISEWSANDPFVQLCNRYDLVPDDLGTVFRGVAQELEDRALRAGYEQRLP